MTAVKICGLSTPDTLDAALNGGADYIGFVFFAKSPRNVDIETARRLADVARGRTKIVALTVDADDMTLAAIMDRVHPDMLQLHGSETVARVLDVKKTFDRPVIKAVAVATSTDVEKAASFTKAADLILFDAKAPIDAALPGGNGLAFDWRALDGIGGAYPFMLSGGLNSGNVSEAIRMTDAFAVDVSSGVESAPGVKDADLIRRFLRAAKTAKQA